MSRKVKVGLTRDFFLEDGKTLWGPGPGPKRFDELPNVEWEMFPEFLPEATPEQIQGFDMVVARGKIKWTKKSLVGNNQLLCILRSGVGYDTINVPDITNAGVMLCITPEAVRRNVAVQNMTFILALSTRLAVKEKLTRQGQWYEGSNILGDRLDGKTLGSIGVGNVGHELFVLAKPFGMKHIAYDPYVSHEAVADVDVKLVDLDTLLIESDYVNIACVLNDETRHLIGEKELRKMKKTAFLINSARGPIVDEVVLIKALQEGWICGAGLDVFEQEPTPPDNPLLKMDNVIVTAHSMNVTDDFFAIMWSQMLTQVSQIIRGEVPEALVNREVWDKSEFQSKLERFLASL